MLKDYFSKIKIYEKETWMRYLKPETPNTNFPVIIFIPGLGGWAEIYEDIMIEAYNRGFYPISIDHIGFGKSGKPNIPYSLETWAAAIVKVIYDLDIQHFHLLGHSMAGSVLMKIWKVIPQKIDSLTLVSPAGFGREVNLGYRLGSVRLITGVFANLYLNKWNPIYRKPNPNFWKISYYDVNKIPKKVMEATFKYNKNPRIKQIYFQTIPYYASLGGQRKDVIKENFAILEKMKQRKFPLHVIWGRNDKIIPAKHALNIKKHYPNAVISIIDKSGHTPYIEQKTIFEEKAFSFLKKIIEKKEELQSE